MKPSKSNPFSCALLAVGLVFCVPAANASLILYDFSAGSNASTDTDANSTASTYNLSGGNTDHAVSSATSSAYTRASWSGFTANIETTLSDFSVSANTGYVLDLENLDFSYATTGVTDTRTFQYRIYTDFDGYTTAIFDTGALSGTGNSTYNTQIDLTNPSYNNLSSIAFRITGEVSNNTAGGSGDNIMRVVSTASNINFTGSTDLVLNGSSVFVVPEPTAVLGLLGLITGTFFRRRRRTMA